MHDLRPRRVLCSPPPWGLLLLSSSQKHWIFDAASSLPQQHNAFPSCERWSGEVDELGCCPEWPPVTSWTLCPCPHCCSCWHSGTWERIWIILLSEAPNESKLSCEPILCLLKSIQLKPCSSYKFCIPCQWQNSWCVPLFLLRNLSLFGSQSTWLPQDFSSL